MNTKSFTNYKNINSLSKLQNHMQGEKRKVRILAMSDTHDMHFRIDIATLPPADIFIHSGDFTKASSAA
jgi:hypothetical protein